MSGLARKVARNRTRDERPTGYALRKDHKRFLLNEYPSVVVKRGPMHAQLMLAASERKLFGRKPTAKTRDYLRVRG